MVSFHNKWFPVQVFLELFSNCPLQGQELWFGRMIVTLMNGQGLTQICNRVLSTIRLFL